MSLKVNNVSFGYKDKKKKLIKPVLNHFSTEFSHGITAITGENGSGKTTLCNIILGILKPDEGSVSIDGKKVSELTLAQVGRKVGYVMQHPQRQIFSTTVAEEVEYGLRNMGLSEGDIVDRRDRFLEYFELERYKDTFPFHLSQGEKQRLVLSAVLAMEPPYLLLDEPGASLDRARKDKLIAYLKDINMTMGTTVVFVSHDSELVKGCADRIVEMERK